MGIEHRGAVTGDGEFRLRPVAGGDATEFCWEERLRFPWWLGGAAGERSGARCSAASGRATSGA